MKQLSEITTKFTESVIREMTRISSARGGINLAQGFPDFDPPQIIRQAAIDAIQQGWNQYAVTFGEADLREAIARKALHYNRIECDPHTEVTVTCGATEAMIATLKALVNPGDEIIIFEPFYENYGPDAILSGARPRYVTLRSPEWSYDSKELTAAFNRNTKAIIINTPNNPTGKIFSRKELEEIGRLCIKWDAMAITDEIYEHILYDQEKHISMASMDGMAARTVTINSLSKTYSVTGWRVGWAIAGPDITSRIRKVHDFLTVGAPTPFQKAGVCALNMPEAYYTALQERYNDARNRICTVLKTVGFDVEVPKGAYYIMAHTGVLMDRYQDVGANSFSLKLLDMTGIATVPGTAFYHSPTMGHDQVRFCFAKNEQTIEAVCRRLERLII
ncbi:aminotransferase class I/II-fold pyridoxal phosphate-dependent enzyme [bacterium]|nr:aminotransferase class I/II-fold pyridoxal phosphate-dependent enzyme [bacterium]